MSAVHAACPRVRPCPGPIERAFAVLGALADGPIGVTEVAERVRPAQEHRRPAARVAPARGRRRAGARRDALPGRRRGSAPLRRGLRRARSLVGLARPTPRGAGGRGRRGRRPGRARRLPRPLRRPGRHARTRSRSATGPAPGSRCTRSRRAWSLLAHCPPGASRDSWPGRWSGSRPPRSPTRRRCATRLDRSGCDGYAWVREEFAVGINSAAAAVLGERSRPVAAIHVHGPSYRFPAAGDEERVSGLLRSAAGRISDSLRRGA